MKEQQIPINIVGSTVFGRYPKISIEQTYNMIISDGWLVPYAGHKVVNEIMENGSGRGIYHSSKNDSLILVVNNGIYRVDNNLVASLVGSIDTYDGDVFIAENDANQIAISDKQNIYIYNYVTNTVDKAVTTGHDYLGFTPGYITFQDGYFISPDLSKSEWRLSTLNEGKTWPSSSNSVGKFQTKADIPVAAISSPGKGGNLLIMGSSVTELWNNTGASLFPYQRTSGFNIDYGCLSSNTIAAGDNFVVWLAVNERSGPVIMYTSGGDIQQISTDGINFKLSQLVNPASSYGFIFKQDGHLFYQLTFTDPADNFTLTYDFNTQKFFSLCDKNMNYHVAKRVASFDNTYYFVSFEDGNLYEMNSIYTQYGNDDIQRIRICQSIRGKDNSQFIATKVSLTMEQGNTDEPGIVDISLSRDGGTVFGHFLRMKLNKLGNRINRFVVWALGSANELVPQFRFYGSGRFVVTDGFMTIQQNEYP